MAGLDYPPDRLEVLVVTDGSGDETPDRARRQAGVVVLYARSAGASSRP